MNLKNATDNFIAMCQDVKQAKSKEEFETARIKAEVYSRAIKDIAGLSVWSSMVINADLEIGNDDTPVCCGIPLVSPHP